MNKLAPGWSEGGVMEPIRKEVVTVPNTSSLMSGGTREWGQDEIDKGIEDAKMAELVNGLAFMESSRDIGQTDGAVEDLI